jgi:hypothetical protein
VPKEGSTVTREGFQLEHLARLVQVVLASSSPWSWKVAWGPTQAWPELKVQGPGITLQERCQCPGPNRLG